MKFYTTKRIDSTGAHYRLIFGERSNGKTYATLKKALEKYAEDGQQTFAYVRRWEEDIKAGRMNRLFSGHIQNGLLRELKLKLTSGEQATGIAYRSGEFRLTYTDEDGAVKTDTQPIGYAFSLTAYEHDKGQSTPTVTTVVFDEFLTRRMYLPDEFVILMNVLSTIVRTEAKTVVYLLGNTVNKYSPYFDEMGIHKIQKMQPGDLDIYEYGNSGLKLAAEYADSPKSGKPSDVYFAFDNPKLQMITSGAWEIAIYPHCETKYKPKDIVFNYFITFQGELLQADIIVTEEVSFTFIHRKTGKIKDQNEDLIFSLETDARPNWRRNILKPFDETGRKIASFFGKDLVFYQDNTVGEIVRNYLQACSKLSIIKA